MRTYDSLSDHDFELLVADLIGADEGVVYEAFARGPDQGVDVRRLTPAGPDIVQCKHMLKSTYSKLLSAASAEAKRLSELNPAPWRYRFVTSQPLTPRRKSDLATILAPWISKDDQILGADDLEGLLNRNPKVEQAHVKLWLSSAAQLDEQLHAAIWTRSRQLHGEIKAWLPRYVDTQTFWQARERLHAERVLIISGPPGIGKTTLARLLIADAAVDGYQPVEVSSDIEEAFEIINDHESRVFYYDDFLGSTFLQDRLAKNEDKRLTSFMRRCGESGNNLLVLTTREHILQQAASWYEELERADLPLRRFLIKPSMYTTLERARIFYNHIWHSKYRETIRQSLLKKEAYLQIIHHRNYSPRLIEYITGHTSPTLNTDSQADYLRFALDTLDNPEKLWEQAFERQLDDACRALLIAAATTGHDILLEDAGQAFESMAAALGSAPRRKDFYAALRVLEDSFLRSSERYNHTFLSASNPSVIDFVTAWLINNPDQALAAINGSFFFDQLIWLYSVLESAGKVSGRICAALINSVQRCFESPNPALQPMRIGGSPIIVAVRQLPHLESHLQFALRLLSADREGTLSSWLEEKLQLVSSGWLNGENRIDQAIELISSLRDAEYSVPTTVLVASHDSLAKINDSYNLDKLQKIAPEVFPPPGGRQFIDPKNAANIDLVELQQLLLQESCPWCSPFHGIHVSTKAESASKSQNEPYPNDCKPADDSLRVYLTQEQTAIDLLFTRLKEEPPTFS